MYKSDWRINRLCECLLKMKIEIQSSIWQKTRIIFSWLDTNWILSVSDTRIPKGWAIDANFQNVHRKLVRRFQQFIYSIAPIMVNITCQALMKPNPLPKWNIFNLKETGGRNLKRVIITFLKIWFRFIFKIVIFSDGDGGDGSCWWFSRWAPKPV